MKDKIILITGAGSGLGQALAKKFGKGGAFIAVNDINPQRTETTVQAILENGGRARGFPGDISRKFAVQAILNDLEDDFGRIDALVNNARITPDTPMLEMDEWNWRRVIDVNLTGVFLLMQGAGRVMRAYKTPGVIVNISQNLAPRPGLSAYLAAQEALKGLTQTAALELAPDHIVVKMFNDDLDAVEAFLLAHLNREG